MIDNGNGTVADESLYLMWQQKSPQNESALNHAIKYCKNLRIGGYSDWRLPTLKELVSLVDYNRCNPAIDSDLFPNTPPLTYWTSTIRQIHVEYNWVVEFATGGTVGIYTQDRLCVRAVRSIVENKI